VRKSSIVPLSILVCSLVTAAHSQQFVTSRKVTPDSTLPYPSGTIYGVADFNGDGRLDFLIPGWMMLQNSNGTFTQMELPAGIPFGATVVADLNGDGHADIVSAIPGPTNFHGDPLGPATLTIALGNGNGTFRVLAPVSLLGTNGGTDVTVRDLNGDGKPDIVAVSSDIYGDATLQTFLNNGNGTFRAGPTYGQALIGGTLLAKGDFNGDGKSDLVVENNFEVQILLGNGDGSFTPGATYNLFPLFVGVGDLNRDHHQDLVVVTSQNSEILLGKGDGTFIPSGTLPTGFGLGQNVNYGSGVKPTGIYVSDFNKDGIPDVAVTSSSSTEAVAVYYGKGNGKFTSPNVYNIGEFYNGYGGSSAFADFNRDGRIDVLSLSSSAGYTIAYGDMHGGFQAPKITLSPNPGSIASGDFNRDGIQDVAVVNEQLCSTCGSSVSIFLGSGKGYFLAPATYPIQSIGGVIALGDVNGDGKLDIVVSRTGGQVNSIPGSALDLGTTPDVTVLLGRGDGTIEATHSYHLLGAPALGTISRSTFLVDVNHDGKLDLIGDWGAALGKGNGQFQAPIPLPASIQGIVDLAPGNFNSSGNPGLAVATDTYDAALAAFTTPAYVYVLDGDGKGSFSIKNRQSVDVLENLITADLNGDGLSDILYTGNVTQGTTDYISLGVDLSQGNDAFSTSTYLIPSSNVTNGIVAADFDRDGKMDVVLFAAFPNGGDIALLRGEGNGALIKTPQFYQGNLTSATVLDLNGDGAPDIAGTDTIGVSRVLNTGRKNP
jgi:hypothetical protein